METLKALLDWRNLFMDSCQRKYPLVRVFTLQELRMNRADSHSLTRPKTCLKTCVCRFHLTEGLRLGCA